MSETLLAIGALLLGFVVQAVLRRVVPLCSKSVPPAAARLVQAAELLVAFLVVGAATGSGHDQELAARVPLLATFVMVGLAAARLCAVLGLRAMMHGDLTEGMSVANLAAALVIAGHVLATGMIAAAVFVGDAWGDLGVSLLFFAIGQVSLHLLVWLFRLLTVYDDRQEIDDGNVAAAVAHAGLSVGVGVLVAHAAAGEYLGFADSMREYGLALVEAVALLVLRQFVLQTLVLGQAPRLRGGLLDERVVAHDVGAGALEAAVYIGAALWVGAVL
ncbi:MAG: DUF350 domain-containing protein [Planctomycetes bacterium]|nr:DUF350 domain-containing protein [Planctomycetota bacterium]